MKINNLVLAFFSLFIIIAPYCFAQDSFKGKVEGVVDGDTITVITKDNKQSMFKLAGIDAPEKDQQFGDSAKSFLSNLVLGKIVQVNNFKKNCVGKFEANVSFNNQDLSLSVIQSGSAWFDRSCPGGESSVTSQLIEAEKTAKSKSLGLWQNQNAVNPSDFRKWKEQQAELSKPASKPERMIFTGLAPTPVMPPGKPKGLYIGMLLDDFLKICGEGGKKSKIYTSDGYQGFSLDYSTSKENVSKGCDGSFDFHRTSSDPLFILSSVLQ